MPTPLGYMKGVPIYWGPACGQPLPAGIVLRPDSITESQAQVMLFSSQGGTFEAVKKQLSQFEKAGIEEAASLASAGAKDKTGKAAPYLASLASQRRQFVLVKVPKDSEKNSTSRIAEALQDAAKLDALTDPQQKILATTWLGAGKADAGSHYSQLQLDQLFQWQQAAPGRTLEICDIDPGQFSPLCKHLSGSASLSDTQQALMQDYADWMEKKDPPVKQLGWIRAPGAKPIAVWAFAGERGQENADLIKGKTGLILAFNVDAMQLPDTAFLYAHKPGLAIGKKGMAGVLRDRAGDGEVIKHCDHALEAANDGEELMPAQAVLVPMPGKAGKLKGQAIILVNGPKVKGQTSPEEAQLLEKSIDNSIEQARKHQITSVALTGISTGEFGFDKVWGGNIIMQAGLRALQGDQLDTVISCMWVDKGLSLQESVAGGALTAVLADPWFEVGA